MIGTRSLVVSNGEETKTLAHTIVETSGVAPVALDVELKIGQPGVYSTLTIGIHCTDYATPAARSDVLDAQFKWVEDALKRNAPAINKLRYAIGQVGTWRIGVDAPVAEPMPKAEPCVVAPKPFDPMAISDELPPDDIIEPLPEGLLTPEELDAAVAMSLGVK